jgi:hypothetical protein
MEAPMNLASQRHARTSVVWKCPDSECPPFPCAPVDVTAASDAFAVGICNGCNEAYALASFTRLTYIGVP